MNACSKRDANVKRNERSSRIAELSFRLQHFVNCTISIFRLVTMDPNNDAEKKTTPLFSASSLSPSPKQTTTELANRVRQPTQDNNNDDGDGGRKKYIKNENESNRRSPLPRPDLCYYYFFVALAWLSRSRSHLSSSCRTEERGEETLSSPKQLSVTTLVLA